MAYDLSHPNRDFDPRNIPLMERDPLLFWKGLSLAMFIGNLVLFGLLVT